MTALPSFCTTRRGPPVSSPAHEFRQRPSAARVDDEVAVTLHHRTGAGCRRSVENSATAPRSSTRLPRRRPRVDGTRWRVQCLPRRTACHRRAASWRLWHTATGSSARRRRRPPRATATRLDRAHVRRPPTSCLVDAPCHDRHRRSTSEGRIGTCPVWRRTRSRVAPATTSSDPRTATSGSTGPVKASVSLGGRRRRHLPGRDDDLRRTHDRRTVRSGAVHLQSMRTRRHLRWDLDHGAEHPGRVHDHGAERHRVGVQRQGGIRAGSEPCATDRERGTRGDPGDVEQQHRSEALGLRGRGGRCGGGRGRRGERHDGEGERRLLLDVVVRQGSPVLQLLSREAEDLAVGRRPSLSWILAFTFSIESLGSTSSDDDPGG